MTDYSLDGGTVYELNTQTSIISTLKYKQSIPASSVVIDGVDVFSLVQDVSFGHSRLRKLSYTGVVSAELLLPISFAKMSLTKDNSKLLVWNDIT